jgi:hypothetical protein
LLKRALPRTRAEWLKRRVEYLRDVIYFETYHPQGMTSALAAQPPAAARPTALPLPRLTGLVSVPVATPGRTRRVVEHYLELCAGAEAMRRDACAAYAEGRGGDDAAAARYASSLAALAQQCARLEQSLAPAAPQPSPAPEVIELD